MNCEVLCETLAEIIQGLHVVVRPVNVPFAMIEVNVRHDKYAAHVQQLCYFGEFLSLKIAYVFENALGEDDVEALIIKLNWRLKKIGFNQIRRRVLYSYIDTIVLDIRPKERHQGRGPAPDIEKGETSAPREPVYNPR
jgi:hypothetical protein